MEMILTFGAGFIVGSLFGIFTAALMVAAKDEEER